MGSYHQASEAIEVIFNKTKCDSLAKEQQQILQLAGQAANSDDIWKAWDIYSKDLETLITKHGVHVKRTPEAIFKAQLEAWDKVVAEIAVGPEPGRRSSRRCSTARRRGASGSASTAINNEADYKSAYEHYFGPMKT